MILNIGAKAYKEKPTIKPVALNDNENYMRGF